MKNREIAQKIITALEGTTNDYDALDVVEEILNENIKLSDVEKQAKEFYSKFKKVLDDKTNLLKDELLTGSIEINGKKVPFFSKEWVNDNIK